jgi:putative flavoprotein involved in K+ transport
MTTQKIRQTYRTVTAVIVGGGQSGLATSHYLAAEGIDHVVLERGSIANSWQQERWDSLRLLTPNWQCTLPGYRYRGEDPDGFMTRRQVIDFIEGYACTTAAPVLTGQTVTCVRPNGDGYQVDTNRGTWQCQAVVIASGAFNLPMVPRVQEALPGRICSLHVQQYRNPDQLADGGVLVVGAAASGLQLADEIQRSGRQVTLAVGEHVRMPRLYRGRDIQAWMHAIGLLDERWDEVADLHRARRLPSSQLVGTPDHETLDLNRVIGRGVRIAGRMAGISGRKAQFSGSLANVTRLADLKLNRLLEAIDAWIDRQGLDAPLEPRPEPTRLEKNPLLELDLEDGGISTVIWATGYRPNYSWLQVPVLDAKGLLRHDGGIVNAPGLYAMGLPFMRRRKSSFLFGAEDDARDISAHLADYVRSSYRASSVSVA